MSPSIEVSEELLETIDDHLAEGESREEFITELVHHYEAEGGALWEGYGGPP
jgi:metal-responsive CopG/Arc/MetJ family transcriptional regulator